MTSKEAIADKEALLPCPFCGGEAYAYERYSGGYSVYGRFWWNVRCKSCDFELEDREDFKDGRFVYPEKDSFARWNHRAPSHEGAMCEGDIEALKERVWEHFNGVGADTIDCSRGALSEIIDHLAQQGRIIGKVE